jgi:cysteine-rich repeat protein
MNAALQEDEVFTTLLTKKFNVQRVNINTPGGRALADKFNVHAVPTIINYDGAGGSQKMIKGFPGIKRMAAALEIGYVSNATTVSYRGATSVCGDGIVDAGEACDDANVNAGDGCSATCQIEVGFFCVGSPSVCSSVCGDGIVAGIEACDDGNVNNGDGCNNTCAIEPGYICNGTPSVCVPNIPGNDNCSGATSLSGITGTLAGDNTNATNSPVANPSCQTLWQKDLWYTFTITATKPVTIAVNGTGMTDPVVAIYSGNCGALVQAGCDDDAGPGNFSLYTGNLSAGTYYIRVLGYGSSAAGIGSFNLVYKLNGICGNNIIESGEECDDGNTTSSDGCSSTCTFENAGTAKGVAINEDGVKANPSAMLDIKSDSKGVLIPRVTTAQRTSIVSPAQGLVVYDITTNSFWYYKTGGWFEISSSSASGFSAFNSSNQAFSAQLDLSLPSENYDDGNNFSSNVFTAPVTAVYDVSSYATFTFTSVTAQTVITLAIVNASGTVYAANSIIVPAGFTGTTSINTGISAKIVAASTARVRVLVSGTPGTQQVSSVNLSGYKVY